MNTDAKLLVLDVESGGLDWQQHSLLSLALAVLNPTTLEVEDKLEVFLKQDVYHVTGQALRINGLNLVQIDAEGTDIKTTTREINHFLRKHSVKAVKKEPVVGGVENLHSIEFVHLTSVAHNGAFDIAGIKHRLPEVQWSKFVSYCMLDTQVIARYLQMVGLLPPDLSCSLRSLAKHFGVVDEHAHTAMGDVLVTAEVLTHMIELGKKQ